MANENTDKVVTVKGVKLVRREKRGPKGGKLYLYQSESASRDWGYWYESATQAAKQSNQSDRVASA